MSLITLAQAKKHLRVLHTHEDDDILAKLNAATKAAGRFMGRPMDGTDAEITQPDPANPQNRIFEEDVTAAILLVLADLYENRGIQQNPVIAPESAAGSLLWFFKKMGV